MENVYQGTYSNNADLVAVSSGEDNFGLDEYEPLFFHPLPGMLMCLFSSILQTIRFTLNSFHLTVILISVNAEWIGYGTFSVFLKFDEDTDFAQDIFYFCHVSHNNACDPIKRLANNVSYFSLIVSLLLCL